MGHDNVIGLKSFDLTIRSMPILMELATCDAFDVLEGGYFYSVLQKARRVDTIWKYDLHPPTLPLLQV